MEGEKLWLHPYVTAAKILETDAEFICLFVALPPQLMKHPAHLACHEKGEEGNGAGNKENMKVNPNPKGETKL